ncbi:hypothetical protein [Leisingera daeponensis]|uniref:hypothetical protein n=1 Tax=Leisingera daeponensis TaxID=405746 RepID=UPI0021BD892B|nr:hypothetical protein [Leisingera daeponensis]
MLIPDRRKGRIAALAKKAGFPLPDKGFCLDLHYADDPPNRRNRDAFSGFALPGLLEHVPTRRGGGP